MNNKPQSNKYKNFKFIINNILGIFNSLFIIALSVVITLNLTPIYRIVINKYRLSEKNGIMPEEIMNDYRGLINYLQNPFIKKLEFHNFSMSTQGEVHFQDVKRIFLLIYIYMFIFIIILILYFFLKNRRDKFICQEFINKYKILNISANYLIIFFILLITAILVDFKKYFTLFHRIFFRNDYWLFDPRLDPIINVLPEEFFMILGIIILSLIILQVIYIKISYYKNKY
ncbi:TIGR01906 family membrane protein [Clostridium sp. CTA-5]